MNYLYTQDNKYLLNETMDAKNGKKKLLLKIEYMNQYTFKKFYQYLKNRTLFINKIIGIQWETFPLRLLKSKLIQSLGYNLNWVRKQMFTNLSIIIVKWRRITSKLGFPKNEWNRYLFLYFKGTTKVNFSLATDNTFATGPVVRTQLQTPEHRNLCSVVITEPVTLVPFPSYVMPVPRFVFTVSKLVIDVHNNS